MSSLHTCRPLRFSTLVIGIGVLFLMLTLDNQIIRKKTDTQSYFVTEYPITDSEYFNKKVAELQKNILNYEAYAKRKLGPDNLPIILGWTAFFGTPMKEMAAKVMPFCPVQCKFSDDKALMENADVIVFHTVDTDQSTLPTIRHPFQRYAFWVVESPIHSYESSELSHNFFNWTITYRSDSDFINNYGALVLKNSTVIGERVVGHSWENVKKVVSKKTKMVAQFVSNCNTPSKRETYIAELSKYISVDVFGFCGTKNCSRQSENSCSTMLMNEYRFYLAFENSVCLEYASEKFWRMKDLVVPVVLRGSDCKNIAPKGSYIAADDFKSPQDLAAFLTRLAANEEEYLKYFEWTKHYWFWVDGGWHFFCEMCQALYNESLPSKTYENMNNWWKEKGDCRNDFAAKLLQNNV